MRDAISRTTKVSLIPLVSIDRILAGADQGAAMLKAIAAQGIRPGTGNIFVFSHKIVSEAEGRQQRLDGIVPSARARDLRETTGKDPRLLELILGESRAVLRARPGVIVVATSLGHIVVNTGIDRSNTVHSDDETYMLLPVDPNATAARLRTLMEAKFGADLGVIISDSFDRPRRLGTTGVAIGTSGPAPLSYLRGRHDFDGKRLETSEVAFADSVDSAAVMVMGGADEACSVVIISCLSWTPEDGGMDAILRPAQADMFR